MSQNINLELLSDDAKCLAGGWFGLMKPDGEAALTLHMVDSKPALRTQAALDELVAKGVISVTPFNQWGGFVYRPLVNCHDAFKWQAKLFIDGKGDHINWVLMEPTP